MSEKGYKNKIRLNSIESVNRLLQRIVNQVIDDEMTVEKARAIGYLLRAMTENFVTLDVEKRLTLLENQLNERGTDEKF